jgi:hypothetical protein
MRRVGTRLICLAALSALIVGLGSGSAAAGNRKLVEGTVYDTTCATACVPECPPPPHCGPITQARSDIICAQPQKRIACPLDGSNSEVSPPICLPESGCVTYPIYSGEGATVNVRRRGSAKVIAALPVIEGHFQIRLGPGEYVLHPYLSEEPCWSGQSTMVKVWAKYKGPIPTSVDVSNSCVAHSDTAK